MRHLLSVAVWLALACPASAQSVVPLTPDRLPNPLVLERVEGPWPTRIEIAALGWLVGASTYDSWQAGRPTPHDGLDLRVMAVQGVLIHVGAVAMLADLTASGHAVALDDAGQVSVTPSDLHDDVAFMVDALAEDLALLLTIGSQRIH